MRTWALQMLPEWRGVRGGGEGSEGFVCFVLVQVCQHTSSKSVYTCCRFAGIPCYACPRSMQLTMGPNTAMFFVRSCLLWWGIGLIPNKCYHIKAYLGYNNTQSAENGQLGIWISLRDPYRFVVKANRSQCMRKHLLIGVCLGLSLRTRQKSFRTYSSCLLLGTDLWFDQNHSSLLKHQSPVHSNLHQSFHFNCFQGFSLRDPDFAWTFCKYPEYQHSMWH